MMRHHDNGNSYEAKQLVVDHLLFQKFSLLSSWREAWQYAGSNGAGADSSASLPACSRKRHCVPHWA